MVVSLAALTICGYETKAAAQNAPAAAPPILISRPVDELQRTVLTGNTHPLARAEFDRGAASPAQTMRRMILVLKRSAEQESALRKLLDDQQTKGSPGYHQWLTPEQFGRQFGPSDADLATVRAWLESHGFQVASISKGRTAIEFSGTAGQVEEAFHTAIHSFETNAERHWANIADPSIPSALAPVVSGVLSLHNFPRKAQSTLTAQPQGIPIGLPGQSPLFTYTQNKLTFYGLGPTDFATIYNVLPLWKAGIDGTGQTIAVVGETNIHLSDIGTFRSIFGLPAKAPNIILNGNDPGVVSDEPEAVLDVSWSGAVARNATIDLVVSASTEASLGVDLSALYIVDNNLAPVMSESYGECESALGNAGNAFYKALWQQAAAEGITVIVAAGDSGSAGCDNFNSASAALDGLAVSGFASTPYNVAVGGTDFDQTAATAPNYWTATNDPATGASALGYIPEVPWNQSCSAPGTGPCFSTSNYLDIVAGSGGPSSCSTQDSSGKCLSGYAKPSWQSGPGVPQDGVRDIPDVSLFASAGMNSSFYILCEADAGLFGTTLPCNLADNSFLGIGGTSASTPAFAGIMAMVNQKMAAQGADARQGNANYVLYSLAAKSGASCNSSTAVTGAASAGNTCVFYDITKGNNSVPCYVNTPDCGTAPPNDLGVLVDPKNPSNPAWLATTGYDLATGLGSMNAANLVNAWATAAYQSTTTTLTNVSPTEVVHGRPVNVTVTVAAKSGSGTPTGSIALMASVAGQSQGIDNLPLVNGTANGTTALLPGGTYNVTAHYSGDGNFAASDSAPVQVTVTKENSQTKVSLAAYDPVHGTFYQTNTIPYGAIFFLRGDVANSAGAPCLPNPNVSQVGCPSGTVSFALNGKTVDAGAYPVNNLGYAEDQAFLTEATALGNYALQAQYSGDASYNPSSTTLNATVTQASTFTYLDTNLFESGINTWTAFSGQQFYISLPVYANSILQAPTGTIAFTENGNTPSGTVSYSPRNGSFSGSASGASWYWAYLDGQLLMTIDTPGTYTFNASYNGDQYYQPAQSPYPLTVTVLDTTFQIKPPIPDMTVTAGQTGITTVSLVSVDNFDGQVNLTCTLPAAMTQAQCAPATVNIANSATVPAQLTITTTAPTTVTTRASSGRGGFYGGMALACILLVVVPGARRKRLSSLLPLILLACLAGLGGCGGGGKTITTTVPDTPTGTYTVNVTATSANITRTGTFNVTVQ